MGFVLGGGGLCFVGVFVTMDYFRNVKKKKITKITRSKSYSSAASI